MADTFDDTYKFSVFDATNDPYIQSSDMSAFAGKTKFIDSIDKLDKRSENVGSRTKSALTIGAAICAIFLLSYAAKAVIAASSALLGYALGPLFIVAALACLALMAYNVYKIIKPQSDKVKSVQEELINKNLNLISNDINNKYQYATQAQSNGLKTSVEIDKIQNAIKINAANAGMFDSANKVLKETRDYQDKLNDYYLRTPKVVSSKDIQTSLRDTQGIAKGSI